MSWPPWLDPVVNVGNVVTWLLILITAVGHGWYAVLRLGRLARTVRDLEAKISGLTTDRLARLITIEERLANAEVQLERLVE